MTTNVPCCYVIFRQDNKILFVLRENTSFMNGFYSLPAGRVEADESFRQGAAREALEEVRLTVAPEDLRYIHTVHRQSRDFTSVDVYFDAEKWTGQAVNAEPDKHSRIEWLPADDLPDTVMDYQKAAIEAVARTETYSEFGWPSPVMLER